MTHAGVRAENDLAVISEYYTLPSPSMRAAVAPLIRANVTGFRVTTTVQCIVRSEDPHFAHYKSSCDDALHAWNITTGNASIDTGSLLYAGNRCFLSLFAVAPPHECTQWPALCTRRLHSSCSPHGRLGAGRPDRRCVASKHSSSTTVQQPG